MSGKELANLDSFALADEEITRKMNVEVTKDDVIAYNVVQVENSLEAEKKILEEQLKVQREKIGKMEEEFKDAVVKFGESEVGAEVKAINTAMAKLGIKNKLEIRSSVKEESKRKLISISVNLVKEGRYGNSFDEEIRDVAFNGTLKELESDIDSAQEECNKLINRLAEIRNALSNMGRLERQAKANFVAKMLAKNAAAKTLLDTKKKD